MAKKKRKYTKSKPTFCGVAIWSIVGIALLPYLLISFISTVKIISLMPMMSVNVWSLVLGIAAYSLFHFFVYQPTFLYVLAHELTHAIFAFLSGSRVRKIKVSDKGGYVELKQSNFIIDLAPYFFPFYSFAIILFYYICSRLTDTSEYLILLFFFLGVSLAFHYLANWETLKIQQPDLKWTGKIFGLIFVSILNLLFVNTFIALLFMSTINFKTIIDAYTESYQWFFGIWK